MRLLFHRSASRHGIARNRVEHVIEHCRVALYPESDPTMPQDAVLFLGHDQRGVPLEVVAIELQTGDLLVIHAMRLRSAYLHAYREVNRWH